MKFKVLFLAVVAFIAISCTDDATANEPSSPGQVTISGTLPVLYIHTENNKPITSKTEYIKADYWIDPMQCCEFEPLGSKSQPLSMQIRGRGHSSWKGVKKPYKIKLDKKTALLGMPKNKHWALLKPDEGNVAGYELGRIMNLGWSPRLQPIEVVLNDEYMGIYFLTETIRIDENRVNIYEQKDKETDPELIKSGWLVEVDNYPDDCQITVPENSQWNLTVKYHSPENLSKAQLDWLKSEFKAINQNIYSTDKTSTGWEEYIDIESMARFFILQEVMDNPDGFHGSFYLHKDENAKWTAGPVWDLSCYHREKTDYTFRMKVHYGFKPHWIGELIQYDNFCKEVEKAWAEVYPGKISEIYDHIDDVMLPLAKAWEHNTERWNDDPSLSAAFRAERIKNSLRNNIEWFNNHLPHSQVSSVENPTITTANEPVKVFNLQGFLVGEYNNEADAVSSLPHGIYIINGRKIKI